MTASVSVVIPTYNGASFIKEALESVFAQTLTPCEIIVADDCSTDGTADLVRSLARHAPVSLRVLQCDRNSGGPAHPMNLGMEAASSEIVAFLDQDDLMCKDKIERVSHALGTDPTIGLVFGQIRLIDRNGVLYPPVQNFYDIFPMEAATLSPSEVFLSIVNQDYRFGGAGGTAVIKRAWQDLQGFDSRFSICWDRDFALRLALRGWKVAYVPHEVFLHREHDRNLVRAEHGARCFCEATQVLVNVWRGSASLPMAWRSSLLAALQARLPGAAYWERRRRRYLAALRLYWLALRSGIAFPTAITGILKVALAMSLHPIHTVSMAGSIRD
ncbi:MAG TPA: glycosyltransferase [Gemmataceae bacterium]|nr:glycosyltransferase [Gemmataceae bacterium]